MTNLLTARELDQIEFFKKHNPTFAELMTVIQNLDEMGGTDSLLEYVQIMTLLNRYTEVCLKNAKESL
jgi:hypothetical protein